MVTVEVVIAFQGFNQQEVDRKPNRATPIGIAPEHAAVRLTGNVFHAMLHLSGRKNKRPFLMDSGQSANAVGRKEFPFIQDVSEHALESFSGGNGQQVGAVIVLLAFHVGNVASQILAVVEKPLQSLFEPRQFFDDIAGNIASPISRSVITGLRGWTDSNGNYVPDCDLGNFSGNGECGPINDQNFGKNNPNATQIDPAVLSGYGKRDSNWDITAEVQHQLASGIGITGGYYFNNGGYYRNRYLRILAAQIERHQREHLEIASRELKRRHPELRIARYYARVSQGTVAFEDLGNR